MSDLIWKLRQWFRKLMPLVVVGALSFGGYHLYKTGFFKRGLGAQITAMAHKIPFFGSKFGHSNVAATNNYSNSGSVAVSRSGRRHSKRHHGHRRHGRGGKHRRHHR